MSDHNPKICVVGSSMTDQIARAPRLPGPGETLIGSDYKLGFGGKGSNQAVMAARLGGEVSIVVKLGRDVFGENTLKNYREQNIHTEFVFFDEELPSGVAPIWVDETTGQNQIIVVPGANLALTPDEVRRAAAVVAASAVVICQNEIPMECNLEAFRLAKKGGARTVLNPAPAGEIPDEVLQLTDILAPNETEAALLTGIATDTEEGAARAGEALRERGVASVIVTLGSRGALLLDEQGRHFVAAETVQAIDSTGAGDAFVGSLAFFLASGLALRDAIQKACRVATRSVLKHGTQSSFPYRAEVEEIFL